MMEKKRSLTFFLISLFIVGTLPITNPVSADGEVDNWPENDAWLRIELISWSANDSVEWDNGGGLPDPIFKICVEADGDNLDCINTPTWENQLTLNNSWNYSMDIPDNSNILNITIECEDNDAFNDDECDMNSDVNYWRLYAEYNWSATPPLTISGDGDDDDDVTWKNAASTWKFTIAGYGDEDGDGITDNLDICHGTKTGEQLLNDTNMTGCSWGQWDLDGDGIISQEDANPFDANIGKVIGGSREFEKANLGQYYECRNAEPSSIDQWPESESATGGKVPLALFVNHQTMNNFCDYLNESSNAGNSDHIYPATKFLDIGNDSIVRVEGNSLGWSTAQKNAASSPLIHRLTDLTSERDCQTAIVSLHDPNHEILTLNYTTWEQDSTQIRCYEDQFVNGDEPNLRYSDWESHIGTFGDFDGNGVLDFVHGVYDQCVIYLGISENPLIFHNPIELPQLNNHCINGPIASADFDNDGFDDIVTQNYVIFMSDDMNPTIFLLPGSSSGNDHYTSIIDYDSDGDLDIINRRCTYGFRDICYQDIWVNSWFPDEDSDGVEDSLDLCFDTGSEEIVDSFGCSAAQKDTDNDTVTDNIDLCPSTNPSLDVDESGCAEQQLDDDNDGINNAIDECPGTPEGDLVNVRGCSFEDSQDLDSDNDGVLDSEDACPNTPADVTVDSIGCDLDGNQTPDTDSDGDGVYDSLDDCANTPFGATVDFTGCPMDSDSDGVYDGIDECPSSNNPSPSDMDKSSEVDSTGCFIDAAGSESDSDSAAFGCLGMIVMIGVVVFVVRKVRSPKQEQVFYAQPQPVIAPVQQQSVPIPQVSSREKELEHQSRQAQIEAQRLRQQLANQAQITQQLQREAAQKQMSEAALAQKQHELAVAQQENEELEAKLAEAEKNTPIVQNITYNIQDSAISGDITNKITRNDSE